MLHRIDHMQSRMHRRIDAHKRSRRAGDTDAAAMSFIAVAVRSAANNVR